MTRPGFFVRHRIAFRVLFGGLAGLAAIVGAAAFVGVVIPGTRILQTDADYRALPRAEIPGTSTVELASGTHTVWIEHPVTARLERKEDTIISIRSATTDSEIPLTFYDDESRFVGFRSRTHAGNSIGEIAIPEAGRYTVEITGEPNRTLVIGNSSIGQNWERTKEGRVYLAVGTACGLVFLLSLLGFILMVTVVRKPRPSINHTTM